MKANRINTIIPDAVVAQVTQKMREINTLLAPYVVSLTKKERKDLPKMADKTVAFVDKVIEYTGTNPKYIPTDFIVVADLIKDFDLNQDLLPIKAFITQTAQMVQDTSILSGHEAYTSALFYYRNVRNYANEGDAVARTIYDDLKKRYPGGSREKLPKV